MNMEAETITKPDGNASLRICSDYKEAVVGGTFNPFCRHHARMIESLKKDGFSYVVVVPAVQNPFKDPAGIAEYLHRVNMLELGVEECSNDPQVVEVERFLLKHNTGPIRTWQVLDYISQSLTNPTFVIGEDLKDEVNRWENIDYIRSEYGIHVTEDFGLHATDVREMIKQGEDWEEFVSPKAARYIKLHGLYGTFQ